MNGRETKFHHENIHYKSNIVCAAFVSVDHSARCYALLVDLSPYILCVTRVAQWFGGPFIECQASGFNSHRFESCS